MADRVLPFKKRWAIEEANRQQQQQPADDQLQLKDDGQIPILENTTTQEQNEDDKIQVDEVDEDDQTQEDGLRFPFLPCGPEQGHCFSKTLTTREANPSISELYLKDREACILIDEPLIFANRPRRFSMQLLVLDAYGEKHYLTLTHRTSREGRAGFSITRGWGGFVRANKLKAGYEISFYRDLDKMISKDYHYTITFARESSTERPKSNTRFDPEEGKSLSKNLKFYDVDRRIPELLLYTYQTGKLIDSPDIVRALHPASFPKNILVFDKESRMYYMQLSQFSYKDHIFYSITGKWGKFVEDNKLEYGDEVSFYKIILEPNVSGYYFYYLHYVNKSSDREVRKQIEPKVDKIPPEKATHGQSSKRRLIRKSYRSTSLENTRDEKKDYIPRQVDKIPPEKASRGRQSSKRRPITRSYRKTLLENTRDEKKDKVPRQGQTTSTVFKPRLVPEKTKAKTGATEPSVWPQKSTRSRKSRERRKYTNDENKDNMPGAGEQTKPTESSEKIERETREIDPLVWTQTKRRTRR